MKRSLCLILAFFVTGSIFIKPIYAEENTIKTIEFYDYYDSKNVTADIYFQNDVPYISPEDLANLTEYQCVIQDKKIVFEKKEGVRTAKRVAIKNDQIVYGPYKEKVESLDFEGSTYIELIPTIDYLDSRLEMSSDGRLLLFSSNKTFSQLVSQVNYDILHGGNISDVTNGLETGTAWLWLLLNGKLLSSMPDERSKRLAYGILTEENKDNFIIRNQSAFVDFCSTVSGVSDVSSTVSGMGDLDFFDESIKKASDRVGSVSEVVGVSSDFLSMIVNFEMQIEQLYLRNIENTKNTLLNKKMGILESKNALYKNLNAIVKGYDKKSENITNEVFIKLYANEVFSFLMDAGVEGVASQTILKSFPAIDAGLSLLKVYGDISGVTDGASSIVEQQDYVSLQSKVAIRLNEYHDIIKKGKKFSKEDINNYVELARMYYHVKTAYYHMYNEYHPDPLFEDGYKTYLDIEREIDQYGDSVYTLDLPNVNATDIKSLKFKDINENLPEIEETPINVFDRGYIVKTNGLYGLMDINGKWIIDPTYRSYRYILMGLSNGDKVVNDAKTVCMVSESEYPQYTSINDVLGIDGLPCVGYGGANTGYIAYDEKNRNVVHVYNGEIQPYQNAPFYFSNESYVIPSIDTSKMDSIEFEAELMESDSDYYILSSKGELFGPYNRNESATLSVEKLYYLLDDVNEYNMHIGSVGINPSVYGLYYAHEGNKYRIFNQEGTDSYPELFDDALVLSDTAIQVTKNGQLGVVDNNFELTMIGDYEAVTEPIGNKVFVKKNGKWKIVSLKV